MDYLIKRKSGGQPGNRNARKHGLYSKVLPKDQKREFNQALKVNGIDQEIALLRVKLNSVLAEDGDNLLLILEVIKTLGRLSYIKSGHGQDFAQLKEAVTSILTEWEIPVHPEKSNPASSDCKNHE